MKENKYPTYTKQEVLKATLEYFNGDELAADVWIKKYCLKDDKNYYELTPDDMHHRIAKELARIEAKYPNPFSEEDIYRTLKDFKRIVPQGSPMSGIGNDFQIVSLSNCFVIGNDGESDSYGGIMKLDQELVQLEKRRGGVGLDLSFVRPSGSPVKNSAITSTGVVPFMERFSSSTKEVAQDGRRGALMESISIKHPDSEKFIDAKLTQGKVTGANISVKLDDDFMQAAMDGNSYKQQYPITGEAKYTKEIDAQKLWKKIIFNAWKSAEPGILFWDQVLRESIPDCYADLGFKTTSTNPCFPASEYLLTENGYIKFGDLLKNKTKNNIVCDNRISYVDDGNEKPENWIIDNSKIGTTVRIASNVFLTQENAEIIELTTSKGFTLKCTPDHHIATTIGMIEAKDITPDHEILIAIPSNKNSIINRYPELKEEKLATLIGLITGDGTFDKSRKRVHIDFWGEDRNRMESFVLKIIDDLYLEYGDFYNEKNRILSKYFVTHNNKNNKTRISSGWLAKLLNDFGFNRETKFDIPEFIINNSSTYIGKYYVAGLMYCDGTVTGSKQSGYTIRLSQSNEKLLKKVQLILHSNGMIFGIYKRRESQLRNFPNGKGSNLLYKTKINYELISVGGSIVTYRESIGFLEHKSKEDRMKVIHNFQIKKSFKDSIIEIKQLNNEPVFCLKEDVGRNIIVNGISARRCGEIPLCNDDSCRLLALNLFGYVKHPFTEKAYFQWDVFATDVFMAQRFMDDIIDLELEKIDAILAKIQSDPEDEFLKLYEIKLWERIKDKTLRGRRTGLGVTGEGDMIAALGLRYGTDEATILSEQVHQGLKICAYRSSVTMAKDRGSFPIFSADLEKNNPFILRIKEECPELYDDMVKYGRRNIALLTIAPTGTVSIMTQTTSGIEPCFSPVYMRRRKINPQEKDVRIDFVDDEGIAWQEYPVFHHKFEMWLKINGYDVDMLKHSTLKDLQEIISTSPYYKATANDVDWVKKVEMQGRLQKHVDHSISVTVNLPKETTEEMVAKVYETGWRSRCKGMTVYRDGSRSGVLVGAEKKEEQFHEIHAPKRPKRLKGEIHRFQNNLEKWIAVVGLKDGRPYEIFTGKFTNGLSNLPPTVKECEVVKSIIEVEEPDENGTLVKIKKKRYDMEYVDADGVKQVHQGLNHAFNPEFWNYAKLVSGVLRHGMPIVYVHELIESLNFKEDYINTWKNGVARVVKKYIKDGEKAKGICPECGSDHLEYKEGCLTCMACGNSKCG